MYTHWKWSMPRYALLLAAFSLSSPLVHASPAPMAQAVATAAISQLNFGLSRQAADDAPETPSRRFLPNLLGGTSSVANDGPTRSSDPEAALNMITGGKKETAQTYLSKGKAALAAGDKMAATAWYQKALATGAQFAASEYSPQKLADEMLRAGVDPQWLKPARQSLPNAAPSSDLPSLPRANRFAGQLAQADGPRSGGVPSLFNAQQNGRQPSRFEELPPRAAEAAPKTNPSANGKQAQPLLHQARQALAAGNANEAARLAQQAQNLQAKYGLKDDTPQKVQTLIGRHQRLLGSQPLAGPQGQSPQFKRQYTQLLIDQADGLIQHNALEAAEKLARRAYQVKADANGLQRTPAQVLAQIASLRRQQAERAPHGAEPTLPQLAKRNQQPRRLPAAPESPRRNDAVALLAQARAAMARGDFDRAKRLAMTAKNLNVPNDAYGPRDDRPWVVLLDIEKAQSNRNPVMQAGHAARPQGPYPVQAGVFRPNQDGSRVSPAQGLEPLPRGLPPRASEGNRLFAQGQQALLDRKVDRAVELFKQAWKYERQLDPPTRNRLQTYLQDLAGNRSQHPDPSPVIDDVEVQQQLLTQKLFSDVGRQVRLAEQMRERDPKGAVEKLKQFREEIAKADVRESIRQQQLTRLDRSIGSLERYIEDNRTQIEQDERNRQIYADVEHDRTVRIEIGEKTAQLVDEFNRLMEEHQFAEAEAIARQVRDLDPRAPVSKTLEWKVRFVRSLQTGIAIRQESEEGVRMALMDVDRAARPYDTNNPIQFPDVRYWDQLTERRGGQGRDRNRRLTEADIKIYNALKTPVEVRFTQRPLAEVIHTLALSAGINVHLDRQGLAAEGHTSDTPVSINLTQPISLRSALNHILEELRLSYVVQDEVLKITSEQMRESDVRREVYNVADLVIPIPNFTPSYNMGMAAALRQAYADLGHGFTGGQLNSGPLQVAGGPGGGAVSPLALGQMAPGGFGGRVNQPIGFGPGGVTGGVQPDFDSLIDLITQTVEPMSWDEVGGPGSVVGFETNLSLVISQTQEVHDEIVDLLEQLRRLQDLQVTIEVRFITLNDSFFERIGVDFDFDIPSNLDINNLPSDGGPSVTIGLDPTGQPTADFDIAFSQDSFTAAVPQFGGFDPATAANFGFAILGEIEAFFLIQAAQGDTRTNVMQAPKVTLFNGQQAFVSDTSQTPFVTSVIPVVGDFAAAHQPVIIVLTEGTSLSVQAVVSPDRRFVRLTIVPFFSKIGEVKEFTFTGRTSSSSSQTTVDPVEEAGGGENSESNDEFMEGTTVQLPTFSFVTVTTTVSVPDGGTVLLGGIKRLSEGRTERGVPMLNKLPYVNRLFKNVGIGRDTQSLMMMVTPRIIIQEEEEEKLGIGGFGTGSP